MFLQLPALLIYISITKCYNKSYCTLNVACVILKMCFLALKLSWFYNSKFKIILFYIDDVLVNTKENKLQKFQIQSINLEKKYRIKS